VSTGGRVDETGVPDHRLKVPVQFLSDVYWMDLGTPEVPGRPDALEGRIRTRTAAVPRADVKVTRRRAVGPRACWAGAVIGATLVTDSVVF
jgi:hypothetical protein